jgi:hypothetical protein
VLYDEDEAESAAAASDTPSTPRAQDEQEPEREGGDEGLSLFRDFINTLDSDDPEGRKGSTS